MIMAKDITKPSVTALSSDYLTKLKGGIAESRASTVLPGGKPFLRLLRDGEWVFGQSDDVVQDGSLWIVNPLSIGHGWSCWTNYDTKAKNELLDEIMVSVTEPKPIRPPNNGEWPYAEQRQMDLRCCHGEDTGVEVLYKTNSVGGMRAFDGLL